PDGKTLASASIDQTIRLWDVRKPKEIIKRILEGHNNPVVSVAFSPDGKTLASASADDRRRLDENADHMMKRWDTQTKGKIDELKGHTGYVHSVVFSPDGKTLASASADQTIKLWDMKNKKEIAKLEGHNGPVVSVAFSSDGRTLASASQDKTIWL